MLKLLYFLHFILLQTSHIYMLLVGLPLTSSLLLEYSSEYLNEYSSTR